MAKSDFDTNERFQRGLALRRRVLGEAHVARSLDAARADPFMLPMQQVTTEFGWGEIWSRPGLEPRMRSFLSVAFLTALGRHDELRTHIRGALNNGVTRDEIQELMLQAALYCGFPAGIEGTRIAKAVFDEMDAA
ncbi:MAG: carboxymuconolactone decarboxylase family protein [Gammaproteobacteria bacterium]|nr:carboxymuconolactone decarboxylase family protein [Gammaproteobacteria bacterium]